MFKLLSQKTSIFSIPLYMGLLLGLLMITILSQPSIDYLQWLSHMIAFFGFALGYFLFLRISLTRPTHLSLFLYTLSIFCLYPSDLPLSMSLSLLISTFVLTILTHEDDSIRRGSYMVLGSAVALNYIFLPASWPLSIFVVIHILMISNNIIESIFQFLFGGVLSLIGYGCAMYFLGYTELDNHYLPWWHTQKRTNWTKLSLLFPLILMTLTAMGDSLINFNKKSPFSRYRYTFISLLFFSNLASVIFFMGEEPEFLLLLILPSTIILVRWLHYISRLWLKEILLWIIFASLLVYRLSSFFDF